MSVDVSLLRQFSTLTLTTLLRQIGGDKDLIIEGQLMKPLDKIAGMSILKDCGVKKVFRLNNQTEVKSNTPVRLYFISSSLLQAKGVVDHLKSFPSHPSTSFHMICVPKMLQSIHILLEEEGLAEKVRVGEFMWQLLPLDADLLSLELPGFFSNCICKRDLSLLGTISKTLYHLECLFGKIPNRVCLGSKSKAILSQLELLENTGNLDEKKDVAEIGHVVIMDRDFDFVSCLLSPVTYEALLDEVFGIVCGTVNFGSSSSSAVPRSEKLSSVRLELSTRDKIFEHIRFKHFATIFGYLSNQAKEMRQQQNSATSMNVKDMKDFVQQRLRDLQKQSNAIAIHIDASEVIQGEKGYVYENLLPLENELVKGSGLKETMAFLERAISTLHPIEVVLRLLCLASCCLNGFSPADMSKIKKLVCEAYGFQHLVTLSDLTNIGLLKTKSAPAGRDGNSSKTDLQLPSFQQLVQKLDLLPKPEAVAESLDRSPSAVFNNIFTPAVCKVVKTLVETPTVLSELVKSNGLPNCSVHFQKPNASKSVLVFFVGGYTMAETASLKALQSACGWRFLFAGTGNVTGRTVIESVLNEL